MLNHSGTPAVLSSPQLKREWIIPLFIKSLFKGNVKRFTLGESAGLVFIAGTQALGEKCCSAGKPSTAPSSQALF